ncbi:MAG: hypothetical protein IJF40_02340 [Clostridia bacterium]|nr:hypothetical protein [Clostridia bacterium]
MSKISVLPEEIANWLSEQDRLNGIRFITEFPSVKKEIPLKRVTVAVGIAEMKVEDSFTENDEGVLVENEYCRLANIKIKLGIHVPYSEGGARCHDILTDVIDCLTFSTDLNVVESGCDNVKADRDTDAFVLEAYILLQADFCPADSSGVNFESFLDKELLCGSHIRNSDIHVTTDDKSLWNAPFVTGSYIGTGATSRSISLGFSPRLVIVLACDMPTAAPDFSASETKCYIAVGTDSGSSMGITITSSGFRLSQSSSYKSSSMAYNQAGISYAYIAFKV